MELLIVVAILLIIAAIAIPSLLTSRRSANESSAVGSARSINTAQVSYSYGHPKVGFSCDLTTLGAAGLVDKALAEGKKGGYVFAVVDCPKRKGVVVGYTWVASPVDPGQTGSKFYCGDQTGVVRFSIKDVQDCIHKGQPMS
ncbi:MAG: pili assembly chaperone [Acidobacteriota bacterium]|nr:pili assembly chaperone [Acidobacteriota bacterium]